ncbi:MAG: hypothetical protein ACR2RL_10335 [Gammaproteobacteria bacterium]
MRPPQSPSSQSGDNAPVDRVVQPCQETTDVVVRLESDDDLAVPEAAFKITFTDGSTRTGRLGRDGTQLLQDVPENQAYELVYTDPEDVRAKIFAARLDAALSSGAFNKALGVLSCSLEELERIAPRFAKYYGAELAQAVQAAWPDGAEGLAVRHLLSRAGLIETAVVIKSARAGAGAPSEDVTL